MDSLPAEAEPKAKKAKKVKDPNAPKKASNAWILYLNAHRDEFRGKHPDMKMPELTKLISVSNTMRLRLRKRHPGMPR